MLRLGLVGLLCFSLFGIEGTRQTGISLFKKAKKMKNCLFISFNISASGELSKNVF